MANENRNIEVRQQTKEGRERFIMRFTVEMEAEQGIDPRRNTSGSEIVAATQLLFTAEAIFWFLEQTADAVESGHDYYTKSELCTQMVFIARLGGSLTNAAYKYLDEVETAVQPNPAFAGPRPTGKVSRLRTEETEGRQ